ncbi:MAG: phage holin family protein [Desulfobacterales bacterium]
METVNDKRANSEKNSISSLFSTLLGDVTQLFRQEVLLAKTEITEKINQAASGGISLAVGGAVVFAGFLVLLHAAVLALSNVVAPWLSALIVGGVVVIVGVVFLMKGRSNLKSRNLAPTRTTASLRRDKDLAKQYASKT